MTIQDELKRLDYEHSLSKKRIYIEKGLLAVVVILVALLGNVYLEKQKFIQERSRFLLDSRLLALQDIRYAYSALSNDLMQQIYSQEITDERRAQYKNHIDAYVNALNKWGMLFSDNFSVLANHHSWLHQAPARGDKALPKTYYAFVAAAFDDFDNLTRSALLMDSIGFEEKELPRIVDFEIWDAQRIDNEGFQKFFDETYKRWKSMKRK